MSIDEKARNAVHCEFGFGYSEDNNEFAVSADKIDAILEAYEAAKLTHQPDEWGTIQHLVKRQIPALLLQLAEKATELDEQDDDQLSVSSDFLADVQATLDDVLTQLSSMCSAIKRESGGVEALKNIMGICGDWKKWSSGSKWYWDCDTPDTVRKSYEAAEKALTEIEDQEGK